MSFPRPRERRDRNSDEITVGSNIPRKKSPGSRAGTASAADVEEARMGSGR
jgi:hypothetical protein